MPEVLLNRNQTDEIKGLEIILVIISHMAYIMNIPPKKLNFLFIRLDI